MAECGSEGARWAIESADLRYLKTDGVNMKKSRGRVGKEEEGGER